MVAEASPYQLFGGFGGDFGNDFVGDFGCDFPTDVGLGLDARRDLGAMDDHVVFLCSLLGIFVFVFVVHALFDKQDASCFSGIGF